MKYKLSNEYKAQAAKDRLKHLISKGAVIELKEIKKRRTIDQNSLYWLWLSAIEKESGHDKLECHLLFRGMFLQREDEYITGIIIPQLWEKLKIKVLAFDFFKGLDQIVDVISLSTTELDTKKMTVYMDKIKDYAAINMGVTLLSLQDKLFNDFYLEYI